MAELLLDRVRTEIRARLAESEAAVREYERLQAALTALGGALPIAAMTALDDARPPASAPARRRQNRGARAGAARAPRGANRAAVLRVAGERPGVSVAELSSAAGVGKSVLYNLLRALEQCGELVREQLPGGATGYRLAPERPPESPRDATTAEPQRN